MKTLMALLLPLLLCGQAQADITLEFTTALAPPNNTLTYYVKGDQLRFIDGNSSRVNLFNGSQQSFVSVEPESGTIARIDASIIDKQVQQLNQQRLDKLVEEEQRLRELVKSMDSEKLLIAESLINQMKYPEYYGAHTFLRVKPTTRDAVINGITCRHYDVFRKETRVRQIYLAEASSLKISASDYTTLRQFLHFNYETQTRLLIARAKTAFTHIDLEKEKLAGIPLQIVEFDDQGQRKVSLSFKSVSSSLLDSSLFQNPVEQK